MNDIKPDIYTNNTKLICDGTDKKNYLIHYRRLKLYVRHVMVVEKLHDINSLRQSERLEKYLNFNTQKRKLAKNDLEKD